MGNVLDIDCGGFEFQPSKEDREETRDNIGKLHKSMEDEIKKGGLEERDPPVIHHFSKGVYCREMRIPKETLIIGKIHKTSHLNIISKGDVSVRTQFSSERFQAPYTFKSEVGTQRVVYAHEDTVWTTIHPTDETDLEKIEEDIIAKDYSEIENLLEDKT